MVNEGAGSAFYVPFFWPFAYVINALRRPEDDSPTKIVQADATLDLFGHLTSFVASLRSFLCAYACIYLIPSWYGAEYPAFGAAEEIAWSWTVPIVVRNLVATWVICGFWDWFLYFSPLVEKLHKYKMTKEYPSNSQIMHDAFFTTTASVFGSIIEIILCHGWASGLFPMQTDLSNNLWLNVILALTITHYRIPHFHLIHRMMHPWRTKLVPDFGKILYKQVHSLHHKSYNPSAFSGTSMHPVESTLYYSAAFIPVMFGLHPVFAIGIIVDCAMGAWLGHDGFQFPGAGDYFHILHHRHFDGNYGASHIPLDKLFGTFIASKEDIRKIHGRE